MVSIIGVLICCVLLGIYLHCSLPSRQWTQERLAFSDALRNLTHGIFLQEVNDVSVIGGVSMTIKLISFPCYVTVCDVSSSRQLFPLY